jgi:ribosomal protein S18 acetylase RimI-like enzyme
MRREVAAVVTYRDEYRPHFERLNRAWIERWFVLEQPDLEIFADPVKHIIAPGGQIFFVVDDGEVYGTCAVVPHGDGGFELAKMAVDPAAQGRGYGDLLMQAVIHFSREAGARRLILVSNTKLAPAIRLYRKHGFVEVPIHGGSGYERANIEMHLSLL